MKWEDYNRMSNRQKEEYNYRFKNHPIVIDVQGICSTIIIVYLLIMMMIFMSYIIITDELFVDYKDSVVDILKSSSLFMIYGVSIIIAFALFSLITMIVRDIKEKKWIRENNIRITPNRLVYVIKKMFKSKR